MTAPVSPRDADVIRAALEHPYYGAGAGDRSRVHAALDALDRLVARVHALELQVECDCVPVVISSRSCPKCGRHGVAFQSWLDDRAALEARVHSLERATDEAVRCIDRYLASPDRDEQHLMDARAVVLEGAAARQEAKG